jgi:hypothetical protein
VGALALLIGVAASSTSPGVLKLGLPIPAMGIAWQVETYERANYLRNGGLDWGFQTIMIFTGAATAIWWLLAVLMALRSFRVTREVEREAAGLLQAARDQAAT